MILAKHGHWLTAAAVGLGIIMFACFLAAVWSPEDWQDQFVGTGFVLLIPCIAAGFSAEVAWEKHAKAEKQREATGPQMQSWHNDEGDLVIELDTDRVPSNVGCHVKYNGVEIFVGETKGKVKVS